MSITLIEGFDLYSGFTTGGLPANTVWDTNGGALTFGTGRFSGQSMSPAATGGQTHKRTLPSGVVSISTGFAVKISALPSLDNVLFKWEDAGAVVQDTLLVRTTGLLQAFRGDSATLLGTSSAGLHAGVWHYVEVELTISGTVGVFNVYLDGVSVLALSAQNTKPSTNTVVSVITACGNNRSMGVTLDDLYCTDAATRLGEQRIETIRASGNTATDDWAKLSGTSAFAMLSDATIDGDTTYIFDSTVGHKTLVDLTDLAAVPASITAVQTTFTARKDDATTRQVAAFNKSGATTTNGATQNMPVSYLKFNDIYATDPNTGLAWTGAAVNALQVGVQVIT